MKAAVLGVGGMGKTVLGHLKESETLDGVVAYDTKEESAREAAATFSVEGTRDLNAILGDKDIRVVFVTAPNHVHKELTVQALKAGKAVMCEKPMANTLADAREMVATAESTGGFLQIGFELHYSKLYSAVKEWIEAGLLGEIVNTHCYYVTCAWPDGWRCKKATCGNLFGEKLSHYVDLPLWWIGDEVKNVYTVCSPNTIPYYEVLVNYLATYRFKNGAVSHLSFIMGPSGYWADDPLRDATALPQDGDGHYLCYTIVGTKGAAETDVHRRTLKRWDYATRSERMLCNLRESRSFTLDEAQANIHNTRDQALDILRRVAEGRPPKTQPRESLETMRLCFAAERSAETGEIVPLASL